MRSRFNALLGIIIYYAVSKPIKDLSKIVDEIAAGNLKVTVPHTNMSSEIGLFAQKINMLKEKSENLIEVEKKYSEIRVKEADEKSKKMSDMLNKQFDEKVVAIN